jgi:hypothetical protein
MTRPPSIATKKFQSPQKRVIEKISIVVRLAKILQLLKRMTKFLQSPVLVSLLFQWGANCFQSPQKGACHMFLESSHQELSKGSKRTCGMAPFFGNSKTLVTIGKIMTIGWRPYFFKLPILVGNRNK